MVLKECEERRNIGKNEWREFFEKDARYDDIRLIKILNSEFR